jgi:GWxTD domain-containing protein
MKRLLYIFLFILLTSKAFATLEVYFMYAEFNSPAGPYIETYMSTMGKSAVFVKNENNKFQAEIEVTMIFKSDDDKIVAFNKYNLLGPEIEDTSLAKPNFIDLQRVSLDNGKYKIEVTIKDINSKEEPMMIIDEFEISFNQNEIQFSGIELIEEFEKAETTSSLTKNGLDLIPYVSNFYPQNFHSFIFYAEIYNSDKVLNSDFLLRYYLSQYENSKILEQYSSFKKLSSAEIVPFLGAFNIKDLPSGNYLLVLEVRDNKNELLQTKKFFFQRSNSLAKNQEHINKILVDYDITANFQGSMTIKDSLYHYISCLRPIADMNEQRFIDNQLKSASLEEMQHYFMEFWLKRNNVQPGELWRQYKEQVDYVDRIYQTPINRGYSSDRGRVYLQYGAPDDIYISKHEPSAYPYEIWSYYKIRNENNKKFIFYNPHIAGKEYELLHSDLTGEIKTPNWERLLNKRNTTLYNHDLKESDDIWGGRAKEEYKKK